MRSHIKALTGHEPPTCPWRVFYDPLVGEVVGAIVASAEQYGPTVLGDDPPAIVIDGMRLYAQARNATRTHVDKAEKAKREAESAARTSANKTRR